MMRLDHAIAISGEHCLGQDTLFDLNAACGDDGRLSGELCSWGCVCNTQGLLADLEHVWFHQSETYRNKAGRIGDGLGLGGGEQSAGIATGRSNSAQQSSVEVLRDKASEDEDSSRGLQQIHFGHGQPKERKSRITVCVEAC